MNELIWIVPLLPLLGFVFIGTLRNYLPQWLVSLVGCGTVLAAFVASVALFSEVYGARMVGGTGEITQELFTWISVSDFQVSFRFLVDPLSAIMLLIVTGIGFLIHLYSTSYMHKDAGFAKFFSYLNLFIFFMLLLVLGSNYLVMFIGWEGVGLCSYLLIGFWYKNTNYAKAAKKAFVMNRIGDLGFLIALFFMIAHFGTLEFAGVLGQAKLMVSGDATLLIITLLLFVAATGKSAQIPLFTWLPDAMAGPTPVSALIHAATMVTAGIYMIARSNIMFTLSPITMQVIAIIGVATAVVAAFIALTQNDIKKVLAYSTVSQLGYMFLGLGVGAFTGAFFHVLTHAFFKALLFLGAGSVIHAMSDEQDMRNMGGLRKALPITFATMLIGTIAIAGIPPFAGFFSKDEILAYAFVENPVFWVLGLGAALMTAFYMFRLLFMTFSGTFRGTDTQKSHLHESPWPMTTALIVLALLSVVGGALNVPEALHGHHWLANFLHPIFADSAAVSVPFSLDHTTEYLLMAASTIAALAMAAVAYTRYAKSSAERSEKSVNDRGILYRLSYHKLYLDEAYELLITKPLSSLAGAFKQADVKLVDGLVNGVGRMFVTAGNGIRHLQTGHVSFYIFMMVLGVAGIMLYGLIAQLIER
ncbi:NADH-quinone oxidoreductase subunit L [Sphingobacterium corticibacter]|uniref:NADH-quinone oxidoreductase subunit L n=1 Tax=Sphingobacterium corticibacter TaxID=2171749 RepID=A0A2T8HKC8_9SPHI|nr:NADH-quinone oxidoreductase subunit L [Sphingobacterium corticibacter]PVH25907.1 NADH-quinone oxidoreductase subunit L [Sphingobacterium corticibacter]